MVALTAIAGTGAIVAGAAYAVKTELAADDPEWPDREMCADCGAPNEPDRSDCKHCGLTLE